MVPASRPPQSPEAPRDVRAALPRLDRHKPKGGPVRPSTVSKKRAWVLVFVHVLIGLHFLHWGLTGESITPLEPSEAMQTFELGRINAGFLLFAAMIGTTLLFGRFACGWACHLVALQDLCAWLLAKVGLKPRPVRSRLLVLAPFVVLYAMFGHAHVEHWWNGGPTRPDLHWDLWSDDLWVTFPKWVMAPVSIVVVGFLIVWWLGAKGFCTHGCPYGAIFGVADRFSPLRIKVNDACNGCGHCTSVCTSNVRVHEEVAKHGRIVDPGCMKCLDCMSVCPNDALHFGLAVPKPFVASQQRLAARADFTWPEEIALAAIALVTAQWTFRGAWFGEGVPLLLAAALGVITAVFALLFWRQLRRPDVTFQHTVLKAAGRTTPAGRWALVLVGAWLLFTAHTFAAQRWKASALATAQTPLRERLNERKDVAAERFVQAHAAVDGALAFDLMDDPHLLQVRGLLRRELQRHDDAERDLQAAWDRVPGLELAGTALAVYRLRAGDTAGAEQFARAVLATNPANPTAQAILRQLEPRGK
jgi:polyferredoxin